MYTADYGCAGMQARYYLHSFGGSGAHTKEGGDRTMSLCHAILGFLQSTQMTGYSLKTEQFDQSVVHFWPAALPQIYRELDRMEKKGWITRTTVAQPGRPNRHECSITPAGKEALHRWLLIHQELPKYREAFLVQLFFSAQLTNGEILDMLNQQLQAREKRLASLQRVKIPTSTVPAEQRQIMLGGLTLDLGIRLEQEYVDWLSDCIAKVRNGLLPST